MNFKELAENTGLEEDEFLEMVELFLETCTSDIENLENAIYAGDIQQAVEAAHSVKGAAGNLGFKEVYEEAKGIEIKARQNTLEGSEEGVKSMKGKLALIAEAANGK